MKTFDIEKVKEIAIDLPNQRQIYIADQANRKLVIKTLIEMGFKGNLVEIKKQPEYLPVAVNTLEKIFFVIPAGIMACAAQSGAKAIDYQKMLALIDDIMWIN
jgi:hypothetical protein